MFFKKENAVKDKYLSRFEKGLIWVGVMVVLMALFPTITKAQEKENGYMAFKMGGNSKIASSLLNAKTNFGFGGGFRLSPKFSHLYLEPGLSLNWPHTRLVSFEDIGFPVRLKTSTVFVDANGTYVFGSKKVRPYLTGGIGFLRNGASYPDFRVSAGSEKFFTKNVGAGTRISLGSSAFVGVGARNYWSKGGNFRTFNFELGFRF